MKQEVTEQQVLKKLNIQSFDQLPEDKVDEFAHYLPNMNHDAANRALNLIPRYLQAVSDILGIYQKVVQQAMDKQSAAVMKTLDALNAIIDKELEQFDKEYVSSEERERINTVVLEAASKMVDITAMNTNAVQNSLSNFKDLCWAGLLLVAGALGTTIISKLHDSSKK